MQTKESVYQWFKEHPQEVLSGEALAKTLGLSRASVWKAVQSLREEGIHIHSEAGKGYYLELPDTALTETSLLYYLRKAGYSDTLVEFFKTTVSTNFEAKQWALEDAPHGSLVVGVMQEGGIGRKGRPFSSPEGGIYMSVILRPDFSLEEAGVITHATAVATCRSIEEKVGCSLRIKWVNDLFYNGKKCCGILTEAGTNFEGGTLDYIVVGVGINFATPTASFTKEAQEVAISLFPDENPPISRAEQIADLYDQILKISANLSDIGFMEEYRTRNFLLGKPIKVLTTEPYTATAINIDDSGGLVIRLEDGSEKTLFFGEVSVIPV